MKMPVLLISTSTSFPRRVVKDERRKKSEEEYFPATTWYFRMSARTPVGSANNAERVPDGRALNAVLVGAKRVKGPSPLSASASPAATTADSRVVWSGLFTTTSRTVVLSAAFRLRKKKDAITIADNFRVTPGINFNKEIKFSMVY